MKKWIRNNKFNLVTWGSMVLIALVIAVIIWSLIADLMSGTCLFM